ncbi:bifunctional 5-dehydro-2-deoxygluconokinase/5-dehydro-2-deoxyphosphogluconate aldolase [Hyphococcus sp.]|uniref:bifunctional 5-dehydro-2-deoxygluconokinase/5-dehydro-2- deoxyphosphogluconate aldolase n=1 Tax=Hyphococcus sp. TaxID=2038636 RepID=UPI0035C7111D
MTKRNPDLDLITIGRSSIDLYGEQTGGRLEDMGSFAKYVGGCPTNIAIGASRLGLKSALITGVGDDHMGRFILEQLGREGVNVNGVKKDETRLTALVILGIRDSDSFPLIFYRENCADMALSAEDIDPDFIQSAKAVLVTGTHLSRENVRAASRKAIACAKEAGRKVIFDIDYRPVLWGLTNPDRGEDRFVSNNEVTRELQQILPDCDLIVGTEEEIHILGGVSDTTEALKNIRERTQALLVCKRGPLGCVAFDGPVPDSLEDGISGEGFEVEVFNVLGAGDAFMGGFLSGWLREEPVDECCRRANAAGAIVVSRHGCAPAMPTKRELDYFFEQESHPRKLSEDQVLENLHWSTTRAGDYDCLKVMAIDHRVQLEDMARELGRDPECLQQLKVLALEAADDIAQGDPSFGVLLDGGYGKRALEIAADRPYWIGRPVERPGSRPLEFETDGDIGAEINTWPLNHVVKCLVFYHPNDPAALEKAQQRQLVRLFDACRRTRHELLVEIIASKHGECDKKTTARVMERIYDLGVYPDWWKLEPSHDDAAWDAIASVINENDRYCRGVVLLGLSAREEELIKSFAAAARSPIVKGFAVGRTIFHDATRRWLGGDITDAELKSELTQNFKRLVKGWDAARQAATSRS